MPEVHAILSASGAHRWLNCPPSARWEGALHETTSSVFAEEGTAAHAFAELELNYRLGNIADFEYNQAFDELKEKYSVYYGPSMQEYIDAYADEVMARVQLAAEKFGEERTILLTEHRLDFSHWVPEAFGTGDVVLITPEYLEIIDLKYGKGVVVSAENNPQLKLYALGAYNDFGSIYEFDMVRTTIIQPRLDAVSSASYTVETLLAWGNEIKPIAQQAFEGQGEFKAGEHCRFCKARTQCRARGRYMLELADEFQTKPAEQLTPSEMSQILERSADITAWIKEITEYALKEALTGVQWPGYKVVEGRSNRAITDEQKAVEAFKQSGVPEALLYERKLISLTKMEEEFGKKKVSEIIGNLIEKPQGKPTLVPVSDKRPEMLLATSAAEDFSNDFMEG